MPVHKSIQVFDIFIISRNKKLIWTFWTPSVSMIKHHYSPNMTAILPRNFNKPSANLGHLRTCNLTIPKYHLILKSCELLEAVGFNLCPIISCFFFFFFRRVLPIPFQFSSGFLGGDQALAKLPKAALQSKAGPPPPLCTLQPIAWDVFTYRKSRVEKPYSLERKTYDHLEWLEIWEKTQQKSLFYRKFCTCFQPHVWVLGFQFLKSVEIKSASKHQRRPGSPTYSL